jgi:hypothetical protein
MERPRLAWLLWLLVLQALDAATTIAAVRAGALELNPLASRLLESPTLLLAVKLLAGWLAWLLAGDSRAAMLLVSALYLQAIAANTANLLKHGLVLGSKF